tara:strand:- start:324 stop:548 length:225 start_codon:yes stop_codon:yes gene_type:complete
MIKNNYQNKNPLKDMKITELILLKNKLEKNLEDIETSSWCATKNQWASSKDALSVLKTNILITKIDLQITGVTN